jgi:hypothetical protein
MAATTDHIDRGADEIPITYDLDTTGIREGEYRQMHVSGEHLKELIGVRHVDLINARKLHIKTSSNMGTAAIEVYHRAAVPEHTNADGIVIPAVEGIPLRTAERSGHVRTPTASDRAEGGSLLHSYHAHSQAAFPNDVTKLTLLGTKADVESRKSSIEKKVSSAWTGFTDKATLHAGAIHAEMDGGAAKHILVTETDMNTDQRSAVYALLKMNPTNTELLDGKYLDKNKSIHAEVDSPSGKRHAYKMTEADFDDAVECLWDSLTTHSDFEEGLGIRVRKTSGDMSVPVMRSGKPVLNAAGKPVMKTVDATTGKTVGRTIVKATLVRMPTDPKLGFIPREGDIATTDMHMAMITGAGKGPGGVDVTPSAAGFDSEYTSNWHGARAPLLLWVSGF